MKLPLIAPLLLALLLAGCGPRAVATPTATGGIELVVMTATPEAVATATAAPSATRAPTATAEPTPTATESPTESPTEAPTAEATVIDPALSELLGFDFALPEGSTTLGGIGGMTVLVFEALPLAEAQRFVEEAMQANGYTVDPDSDPAAGRYTFAAEGRIIEVRFADEVGRVTATFFPRR